MVDKETVQGLIPFWFYTKKSVDKHAVRLQKMLGIKKNVIWNN